MIKVILNAVVAFSLTASAAALAVDQDVWNGLIRDAIAKGEEKPFMELTAYSFKQGDTFDPAQERTVQYFTTAGRKGLDGTFVPLLASTVEEVWTRVDGNWRVDQLLRAIYMNGTLKSITHNVHIIADTHRVLKTDSEHFNIEDPRQIETFEKKIIEWSEFAKAANGLKLPFSN